MADTTKPVTDETMQDSKTTASEPKTEMSNILSHIKTLESSNVDLKAKLEEALERNGKLSQKTREGMESALDTLMKKWMDAVETKDAKVKDGFKDGLEKLVKNGTWMDHKPEAIFGKKKKQKPKGPQSLTDKQFTADI